MRRDYLITLHVLQAEQRLPHATEEKAKRSFPKEGGSIAKHHPAWNPQRTQRFRAEGFPLRCPKPKVMPRFSLGDVGDSRWLLSHRWTDTSPILSDAAHDSRDQGRVVSLSVLSLLSACVRLRQLREVHHSLQQALNPWSRTQSAATDGSPACCTSSLMLRVCVMLRVLPSQSSVRSLLVLLLYKERCLSCLARPVGHYRPLQRRSATDKCSVRCRPIKQRGKIYRNLRSKPNFDKVHFCRFSEIYRKSLPSGQFLKK